MTATVLTDEQVGDLYQDWHLFFKNHPGGAANCIRAIEQAVLQSKQVQAWEKDAARYRWLTKNAYVGEWATPDGYEYRVDGADREVVDSDNVHAAIDAAMEKQT